LIKRPFERILTEKSDPFSNQQGPVNAKEKAMRLACGCFIVPKEILDRFAKDKKLSETTRKSFADTSDREKIWRTLRAAHNVATKASIATMGMSAAVAAAPRVSVYDCANTTSIPGTPVSNPGGSSDLTAKRAFDVTTDVAKFYKSAFGRNSIDNAGMTLLSNIHFSTLYNNAFWDGNQMTYGDGDGHIFVDFTKSNDVVAHELTHGVTQFTLGLNYTNEAGGLNESMSDVFGTMFRQWEADQAVGAADWLIGAGIMGPDALARGFTCLRDMAKPGDAHCLAPQPFHMSGYRPGMDPHESSGIGNFAFYTAAMALGGKSWEKLGKVWYAAMTGAPSPNMRYASFARRTRLAAKRLYPKDAAVYAAVNAGWNKVGVP
jgi:Zn-dependent metalloprotease